MNLLTRFFSVLAIAGMLGISVSAQEKQAEPTVEDAIRRGVDFLLEDQNKNGSWGSARQTKGLNIYAPIPGAHHAFRAAVTAMSVSAIIESGYADKPGPEQEAVDAGEVFLLKEMPEVRRATADAIYNVWAHAYGLDALAKLHGRSDDPDHQKKIRDVMQIQVDRLERYESIDGGWGYYDFRVGSARPTSSSISFTTATILTAFHETKKIEGVKIPQRLIDRAIDSIQRQRKSNNTYLYGEYFWASPMYRINRAGGSLGRSQACNFALRAWGDETITDEVMDEWLDRLWERNGWLDIGRKRPIPHEAWFAVAGYFYYYGHYYAGLCLEGLPPELQKKHQPKLAGILMSLQEKDGSWWDFPFYSYHQPYGTAFAVMTLSRCR